MENANITIVYLLTKTNSAIRIFEENTIQYTIQFLWLSFLQIFIMKDLDNGRNYEIANVFGE